MNLLFKQLLLFVFFVTLSQNALFAQYTNLNQTKAKEVVLRKIESLDQDGVTRDIDFSPEGIIAKFVNNYLSNLSDEITKEIDGDVQISFDVDAISKQVTSRRNHSPESVNQPSGFVVTCKIIADQLSTEMVEYLLDQKTSKKYIFTYGPAIIDEQPEENIEDERMIEMVMGSLALDSNEKDQRVYNDKAVQPEFPGGNKQLNLFLYKNIIAPLKLKEPNLSKTLSFQFTVEKDGSFTNTLAIANRGTAPSLFALEVINRKMPNWIPAAKSGNYVRSQYILQIRIKPVYTEEMIRKILNPE